jgi:hypothetical protein
MILPPKADALVNTWWQFVTYAAHAVDAQGKFSYTLTDTSAAASEISKTVGGAYASYSPIGISQLFSIARTMAKAGIALRAADHAGPIDDTMVAEPPWSRPLADQLAAPAWHVTANVNYINEAGDQVQEFFTVLVEQTLPSTVGDLHGQVLSSLDSMLTAPPGQGTPRRGTLVTADLHALLVI